MDVGSRVEQRTTAWMQEVERLRRQSRGAIAEEHVNQSSQSDTKESFESDPFLRVNAYMDVGSRATQEQLPR